MRCAFLAPHFGAPLPPYFPFWARSCEANAEVFHWYVYSDAVREPVAHNPAVTLIPFCADTMTRAFADVLGLRIPAGNLRKICDYRVLFYFLRRTSEPLDDYDFVGYTDLDMIYGRIAEFLPPDPGRFGVIAADPQFPCGPFTMMHRDGLARLPESAPVRAAMEAPEHAGLNESRTLLDILGADRPVYCETDALQPARRAGFRRLTASAVWRNGRVTVSDDRGHHAEGAFFHFKRFKGLSTFHAQPDALGTDAWIVDRLGIRALDGTSVPAHRHNA